MESKHGKYTALVEIAKAVLARLDVEAQTQTIFPCATMRDELRIAILAVGEKPFHVPGDEL